jgi:GMP synthase-like glutamine amidotransferase
MKILIVDNGTSYLPQLQKLLAGHTLDVVPFSQISPEAVDAWDAIVLSGGHSMQVNNDHGALACELRLVRESLKPIFGICFGFEVIARAFGAQVQKLPHREHGFIDIDILAEDPVFGDVQAFKAYESHRWGVRSLPGELIPLAQSEDGIETFKHKTRPIYAVQFHPEMSEADTCGTQVLERFLNGIGA